MTKQTIIFGTAPTGIGGDSYKTAFTKTNENFDKLFEYMDLESKRTQALLDSNVASATKLKTARTINGVGFDGTKDIEVTDSTKLPLTGGTLTGNLTLARGTTEMKLKIGGSGAYIYGNEASIGIYKTGGVSLRLDNETGVVSCGSETWAGNLTGNAGTATKLKTSVTIHGVKFDGSANITLPTFSSNGSGLVPARSGTTTSRYLREDGTWVAPTDTTYPTITVAEISAGTSTSVRVITPELLKSAIEAHAPTPPVFTTGVNGLVPARVGTTATKYLREDGSWVVPTGASYTSMTTSEATTGTATTGRVITAATLKSAIVAHAPVGGQFLGNATTKAIAFNAQTIAENITIPSAYNGLSAGPITIENGFTVTISNGATWTIV